MRKSEIERGVAQEVPALAGPSTRRLRSNDDDAPVTVETTSKVEVIVVYCVIVSVRVSVSGSHGGGS